MITIYTDGGCDPNPGPGGWAAVLQFQIDYKRYHKKISGGNLSTTNNRMEIVAVIEALKLLKKSYDVTIFSDSQYVVKSIGNWDSGLQKTGWLMGWAKNGWRKKNGVLSNVDLWKEIYKLVKKHKSITMKWVKGHSGNKFNELCDELATKARMEIMNDNLSV